MSGKLAGYRLDRSISQSGMAAVYLARDERLDRQVALKVLAPDLGGCCGADGGGVARLRGTSGGLGIIGAAEPSGKPPGKGCLGPDKGGACEPSVEPAD